MTATLATGRGRRPARAISAAALVGRDAELATLRDVVTRPPSVAVVEGEAGIGKTRLVGELLARPDVAGRRLLVGACRQVRDPFPLGPVVEAVRQLAGSLAGAPLSPLAGTLRPLLPELADELPPAPEPVADPPAHRHRVFRALVEVLTAAGAAVLVLEDLHWADDQTPDFLRYLLADPPPQLSTVLTYRHDEATPAVRALTARLPRTVHHARVALRPLDVAATGALAAAILGAGTVSHEFASYLCERASGLPFAVEELLALLQERGDVARRGGRWARRALDRLDVPTSIRAQVLERVSHLGADARTVLDAAAVLQVETTVAVLAATCPLPGDRLLAGLDEAVRAGILVSDGDRVRYRHVLAAQAVYEDLSPPQRQRWHARAADALLAVDPPPLSRIAHHLRAAGRLAEWVDAAERAAEQAIARGDPAEAARLLAEVLRHAPLADHRAGRVAVTLGRAVDLISDHGVTSDTGDAAELLARVLDERDLDDATRGELCLRTAVAMDMTRQDVDRQRRLLHEAIAHLRPEQAGLRAWAMVCLGTPIGAGVGMAEVRRWLARAVAEVAGVDDPAVQVRLLGKVAMVLASVGDHRWRRLVDRIEPLGDAMPHRAAWTYYCVAVEAGYVGHHRTAGELLDRAARTIPEWESPTRHASLRCGQALVDFLRGEWDGLPQRADELVEQLAGFAPARQDAELVVACLRLARGDLAGARRGLRVLRDTAGDGGLGPTIDAIVTAAWIRLTLADGDPAAAARVARHHLAGVAARGIWAPVTRCLPALTEALIADGDPAGAADLVARARARLRDLDAPLATAALTHSAALLAAADHRWREASEGLLAAAEEYERRQCPYEAAQAREKAAECRFAAGEQAAGRPGAGPRAGGRDAVAEPLHAALATYRWLGAAWDLNRAARLARRHGVSLPARHRRGRRGYGARLSPREREVAGLMAAGRTNQEIAADLFLSVSTVEKHAMAVLRKLRARSRREVGDLIAQSDTDASGDKAAGAATG
jgi:DNA-binding CsgD family transcriptional regulator